MHFEKYISLKIYNKYLIPKKIFVYNEYLEYERSLDLSSNPAFSININGAIYVTAD